MRQLLAAAVAGAAVLVAPAHAAVPQASGDVARAWTALSLDTVRATNGGDAAAARLYAMVEVAMYDAVNGLPTTVDRHAPALVPPSPGAAGDPVAAAAGAAHDVLAALYPARAAAYDARLAADLATVTAPGQATLGRDWGARVAARVLDARANDGSAPAASQAGGTAPGEFRASWSGVQYRNLAPFAIADPAGYVSAGPPALTSAEYAAAFADVTDAGSAATPDEGRLATYRFWALGANSVQPPGAWLGVASSLAAGWPLARTTRLLALESMAMADTVAPTYATKYRWHSWRPVTAIREADTDGNAATVADPSWSPRGGSAGSSPEHWSGHSSFSAAAATVLAGVLCTDAVPFSLDTGAGQPRTYASFSAAAAEAGRSRVVGGLHFEFSNQAGLAAGRAVAGEVLTSLGPTDC
ncbi:MAG TPA: vanadium-dependent haloperoxidase [Mycobacteriales bacterium]|nr:vanadium-dependent haloperoxidase [Mycobacteriales bacterium]